MAIFSSSKPISGALSSEEWEVFEASAEKMGSALVSYLKNIVGDVHSIMDSQRAGFDGVRYETMFGRGSWRSSTDPTGKSSTSGESEPRQDFKFQDQQVKPIHTAARTDHGVHRTPAACMARRRESLLCG
jgi:hypothetical protein